MKNKIIILSIFIVGILLGAFIPRDMQSMEMKRENFLDLKYSIQGEQLTQSKYRCCLVDPCTYCIEKTPGHGEGAECSCQEDIYNGMHPCGECIGEILEGHGNPLMAEYFAAAIAEEVGHIETIRQIISEKYGIPADEQL